MPSKKDQFQRLPRRKTDREITLLKISLNTARGSIRYTLPVPKDVDIFGEKVTQAIMMLLASDPDAAAGMEGGPPEMSRRGVRRWVSSEYHAEMVRDWGDASRAQP